MEKFYLEEPSMGRKNDVLNYMLEHQKYNSHINGSGSFDRVLEGETYEECLERCLKMTDEEYAKSINKCPGKTFFLIRRDDDKLIGMINVRYNLTDFMLKYCGHIGYGIRPTERKKGYSKISLYLGLMEALKLNIPRVMISCDEVNVASEKTIKALGGIYERSENFIESDEKLKVYWIDTYESLEKYKDVYEPYIYQKTK